jgi:predicted O-methyltransferase YrrM
MDRTEKARTVAIALRNIVYGANLRAAIRLLRRPRDLVNYSTQSLFIYDSIFNVGLPQKNVRDVLPHDGHADIRLFLDCEEFWINQLSCSAEDIVSLCLIARLLKPKQIFEIGTLNGYTALHFAANAPDAIVYTLDLPPDTKGILQTTLVDETFVHADFREYFADKPESERINRLYGDSATFDFSRFQRSIDFFFIDGAHSYEYVRNDTLKALECCHSGSVIAWHDYGRSGVNGVSRWLHEVSKSHFEIFRVPSGSVAFAVVP